MYSSSSFSRCGKMNLIALTVILQAMTQSPWVSTDFAGLSAPKWSSRSPRFSMVQESVVVEYIPVNTASRLTDFPARMLFHSMSGNSGTRLALRTLSLVSLKLRA